MTIIKDNIAGKILSILGAVGILTVAIIAPNAVQIIGKFCKSQRKKFRFEKFERKKYQKSIYYLKRKGYINSLKKNDKEILRLTKKGRKKAFRYMFLHFALNKSENWDGWWRLVGFDIPNSIKFIRDALRRTFKMLKFYQLQKSLFITPYPCEEEIKFLKRIYKIEPYIKIFLVKSFDNEKELLQYFKLKK